MKQLKLLILEPCLKLIPIFLSLLIPNHSSRLRVRTCVCVCVCLFVCVCVCLPSHECKGCWFCLLAVGVQISVSQPQNLPMCIRDLDRLNFIWWFNFGLRPIFATALAVSKNATHLKMPYNSSVSKVNLQCIKKCFILL